MNIRNVSPPFSDGFLSTNSTHLLHPRQDDEINNFNEPFINRTCLPDNNNPVALPDDHYIDLHSPKLNSPGPTLEILSHPEHLPRGHSTEILHSPRSTFNSSEELLNPQPTEIFPKRDSMEIQPSKGTSLLSNGEQLLKYHDNHITEQQDMSRSMESHVPIVPIEQQNHVISFNNITPSNQIFSKSTPLTNDGKQLQRYHDNPVTEQQKSTSHEPIEQPNHVKSFVNVPSNKIIRVDEFGRKYMKLKRRGRRFKKYID